MFSDDAMEFAIRLAQDDLEEELNLLDATLNKFGPCADIRYS